jgi:hypothetical protein
MISSRCRNRDHDAGRAATIAPLGGRDTVRDPRERLRLRDAELVEEEAIRGAWREVRLPFDRPVGRRPFLGASLHSDSDLAKSLENRTVFEKGIAGRRPTTLLLYRLATLAAKRH